MKHRLLIIVFAILPFSLFAQYSAKIVTEAGNTFTFSIDSVASIRFETDETHSFDANGYEYVDLDLPSGKMWATCNIGAKSPEEFGNYYAFGEVEPMVGEDFIQKRHYMNDEKNLLYDMATRSDPLFSCYYPYPCALPDKYDAAHVVMGGDWQIPTEDDYLELKDACEALLDTINGIPGCYWVSKSNGNSIFFPFAGYLDNETVGSKVTIVDTMHSAKYYTSNICTTLRKRSSSVNAFSIVTANNKISYVYTSLIYRPHGTPIRAVSKSKKIITVELTNGETQSHNVEEVIAIPHFPTFDPNGYDYVDLGLPSGLKWAAQNVGAKSPSESGDFFSWGETKPKESYTNMNYLGGLDGAGAWISSDYGTGSDPLANYCYPNFGPLPMEYDAARANMGGTWRMPTLDECLELKDNCIMEPTTLNGVDGYQFTSKTNGASIFIPCVGRYGDEGLESSDCGSTLSSDPLIMTSSPGYDAELCGALSPLYYINSSRYQGLLVRAVSD